MARVITLNNARTQSIETAVEELSKKDSITMTEVREFMDDLVSQKIPTGEKAKYWAKNGLLQTQKAHSYFKNYFNILKSVTLLDRLQQSVFSY